MTAKAIKNFLLVLTLCLTSVPMGFSESKDPPKQSKSKNGHGVLNSIARDTNRKRMPSNNILEIILEDGVLTIESDSQEGEFNVVFENEVTSQTYEVSLISVGEGLSITMDSGFYLVTANKTDGTSFSGEMEVY